VGIRILISCGRDELRIALSTALGCEKVVVSASLAIGIAATHRRPRVVDSAPALFAVQKLADLPENMVLLVAQDSTNRRSFCITPLGLLIRNTKVVRDSQQVAFGYLDAIITAAIGGTLGTIVHDPKRAGVFL
jgi:hypothetical protein